MRITPDADACSVCGENVGQLLPPEYVSDYFAERVTTLATSHTSAIALVEAQRGLGYQPSSELYLLTAILAKQLGHFHLMRRCVAAIPVGDSLRAEAEWLVRSHQDGQRAMREGRRTGIVALSEPAASGRLSPARWRRAALALLLIGLIGVTLWGASPALQGFGSLISVLTEDGPVGEKRAATPQVNLDADPNSTPAVEGAPVSDPDAGGPENAAPADTAGSTPPPGTDSAPGDDTAPTDLTPDGNTPGGNTPAVPDNVVEQATPPALAATNEGAVVDAAISTPFELAAFLAERGRPDLAALSVQSVRQEDRLILAGSVAFPAQRREVVELAATVPGITDVSDVDITVRLPSTYTVIEGDTLWLIAFKLFEDGARWPEVYDNNRTSLSSSDALRVGQVLQVPQGE